MKKSGLAFANTLYTLKFRYNLLKSDSWKSGFLTGAKLCPAYPQWKIHAD